MTPPTAQEEHWIQALHLSEDEIPEFLEWYRQHGPDAIVVCEEEGGGSQGPELEAGGQSSRPDMGQGWGYLLAALGLLGLLLLVWAAIR